MLIHLGIVATYPFERHRGMLFFLVAIVLEDGAELGARGGLGALVVPVDGLQLLHERNDGAMLVDGEGVQLGGILMQ